MNAQTYDRKSFSQLHGGSMSRRSALRGLGGGAAALALVASSRVASVVAQEAPPSAMPSLFTQWAAAWTVDPAGVADLHAEDAVLEDVATGVVYDGADAIRAHIEEIRAGLPDAEMTVTTGFVGDAHAVLEYVFSGTYTGQLPGLPPGGGQPVTVRGVALFELADRKIVREAHYYDAYAFLIQLGVLPAPGAAASPTP
jgi:steroid delta-isomerase-like uncharacterized protein